MRNYIILNGKNSNTIQGLLIQSLAPITKPMIRTQVEEIDGRDGDIVTSLGYSSYDKTITIGLYGNYDVNEVIEYFNSNGIVIFSNEPDKYYNYQIDAQIDFERLIRFKTATVTMHCQPFKYSTTERPEILSPTDELLTIPDWQQIKNGVTVSCISGVISVSGNPTSATEFYLPITALALQAGSYTLTASANGQNPNNCSIRMIETAPSDSDSFGNRYMTLVQGTTSLSATLAASKTFNYIWFYMSAGATVGFTLTLSVADSSKAASDEGVNLALENTAEAPFSRFDLKGNTEQETIGGKNLLDYTGYNQSYQGLTTTLNADGTLTTTGVPTSNYTRIVPNQTITDMLEDGATYTVSKTTDSPLVSAQVQAPRTTSGTDYYTGTFTVNKSTHTSYIICVQSTTTAGWGSESQTITSGYQLEKGSTATAFERYVGGSASPNPDYPQAVKVVTKKNAVKITGKNMFDYTRFNPSNLGITTTMNEDGSLTITGIPTIDYVGIVDYEDITDILEDGATYALSQSYRPSGTKQVYLQVRATDINGAYSYYGQNSTFTVDKTSYPKYQIHLCTTKVEAWGDEPLTITSNFQLEKGSTATAFERYRVQSYNINLNSFSRNLFDKNAAEIGYRIGANGSSISGADYFLSDWIPVDPNAHYVISPSTYLQYSAIATYDSKKTFIRRLTGADFSSITTDSNAAYVRFATDINSINTTQLERGTEATAYVSYSPLELAKIGDYQDYIHKSADKWFKHKEVGKYTFTGASSEPWVEGNDNTNTKDFRINDSTFLGAVATGGNSATAFIDRFTGNTSGASIDSECFWFNQSGCIRIRINKSRLSGIAASDFKTWLSSNQTTVYYRLATSVEEEITDEALKAELESIAQANSFRGRTHITSFAVTGNMPHIISAEALAAADGTITNNGNIYSKPKLTIFGSGDIAVYLNNVQMFQIALGDNQYITIDTAALEAYKDTTENLMNRLVTGDYQNFAFQVGDNTLTFSGTVTECVVENYSRWL